VEDYLRERDIRGTGMDSIDTYRRDYREHISRDNGVRDYHARHEVSVRENDYLRGPMRDYLRDCHVRDHPTQEYPVRDSPVWDHPFRDYPLHNYLDQEYVPRGFVDSRDYQEDILRRRNYGVSLVPGEDSRGCIVNDGHRPRDFYRDYLPSRRMERSFATSGSYSPSRTGDNVIHEPGRADRARVLQ
jgi:hypothetical protein